MAGETPNKLPDLTVEQAKGIIDTNQLIADSLKNGALNNAEAKEIMSRLKDGKNNITQQAKEQLSTFLKELKGWDGLKKVVRESKVVEAPIKAETPAPAKVEAAVPPSKQTQAPVSAPVKTEPLKAESSISEQAGSVLDGAKSMFGKATDSVTGLFNSKIDGTKGTNVSGKTGYEDFVKKSGLKQTAKWEDLPKEIIENKDTNKVLSMSLEGDKVNVYFGDKRENESSGPYIMKYGEIDSKGKFEKSGIIGKNFSWDNLDNNPKD